MTTHGADTPAPPAHGYRLKSIQHVQLAIPPGGEDLARRFYGEILGLREIDKPPVLAARGGCWFTTGTLQIHLGVEVDFRPAVRAHPGFLVDDVDALARRLISQDCAVEWDEHLPGYRRFYVHDLHGNRIEALAPCDG